MNEQLELQLGNSEEEVSKGGGYAGEAGLKHIDRSFTRSGIWYSSRSMTAFALVGPLSCSPSLMSLCRSVHECVPACVASRIPPH